MNDLSGQQWGKYRLVRLLGQGAFAEVYLGEHIQLKMPAAVKILYTHLSQEGAASFLHEAQTVAGLLHPHIVRVLDFDTWQQQPFLIMDYAPHGSLRAKYPYGTTVPLAQVSSYVQQVASALQYAHDQHLIHRDVKPENMLLGHNDEVLLSDFGIVTLAHSTASMGDQPAVGTLFYMAPEQIQGQPQPASDQYALAVTTYTWLCGRVPFDGSMPEIIAQHLAVQPPSLRANVPEIPAAVEQVVLRALAKEPEQRYPCIQDFSIALVTALQTPVNDSVEIASEDESMIGVLPQHQRQGAPTSASAKLVLPHFSEEKNLRREDHHREMKPLLLVAAAFTTSPRRKFSVGAIIGLAVLFVMIVLLFFVPNYNRQMQVNVTATVQKTAQVNTTATMNARVATARVEGNITATAEVRAIATAQVQATATFASSHPIPGYFSSKGQLSVYELLNKAGLYGNLSNRYGSCQFKKWHVPCYDKSACILLSLL